MDAVGRQEDQDDEVGDQDQQIKAVRGIEPFEGRVAQLLLDELCDAALLCKREGEQDCGKREQGSCFLQKG